MKIQFLGTAAAEGWPAVFCGCEHCARARELGGRDIRTRSQAIVDDELLIDLPPDTYMHAVTHGLRLYDIEHLIVTHSHGDHWYPRELMMLRPPFAHANKRITVYGNDAVGEGVRELHAADPVLMEHVTFHRLKLFESVRAGRHTVTALRALHNRAEECLMYLITDNVKTILYAQDTGIFPEDTWDHLKGQRINLVVMDCTNQGGKEGTNHMGLPDNAVVKDRLVDMGAAGNGTIFIVNHFSHNGGYDHARMTAEAQKIGCLASYDGMAAEA